MMVVSTEEDMTVETTYENEMRQRALAAEGALLLLVDRLDTRGVISLDDGDELLLMLSKSGTSPLLVFRALGPT
jgi:hypothetical protein